MWANLQFPDLATFTMKSLMQNFIFLYSDTCEWMILMYNCAKNKVLLREKRQKKEFFIVRNFLYSDSIRRFTM